MRSFILASCLLAFATAAAAQTPPPAAATPATPATPSGTATAALVPRADGDEIICRRTAIVGSRLSSVLCLPKRRWAQMHQDGQDFIRNLDERSSGGQERPF